MMPTRFSQVTSNWVLSVFVGIAAALPLNGLARTDAASANAAPTQVLREVSANELPTLLPDGDLETLRVALRRQLRSCERDNARRSQTTIQFGSRSVTRREWCLGTGRAFLKLAEESADFASLYAKARNQFKWYQSAGATGAGDVRFTGYYFPVLEASRTPTERFKFPFYRLPSDLVQVTIDGKSVWRRKNPDGTFSMYWDRAAIDGRGALRGKGLEIGYVESAYEAFVMDVQGAGALIFTKPDGSKERVILNYSGQNGHPYVGIGSVLKQRGVPGEYLSMPGMKRYFRENPDQLESVLYSNPSYVFFKESKEGPLGTEVVLSPGHSIAIDRKLHPMGAVALLQTTRPEGQDHIVDRWLRFSRLAVTQDVGGAIRGPGRVDFYWGEGTYAEFAGGHMNQQGVLYFPLLP
jgi:membrane-bound lytic murein transglycosylase A